MTCASMIVFAGYRWHCARASADHDFHIADLPTEFADRGFAVVSWGTSHQAPVDDPCPRYTGPIYTDAILV